MPSNKAKITQDPVRLERLGFRLDKQTKNLINAQPIWNAEK